MATLTAVLLSSSEALLPPPARLLTLMRLLERGGRIMALMGRWMPLAGEPGGEVISIVPRVPLAKRWCVVKVKAGRTRCCQVVGLPRRRRSGSGSEAEGEGGATGGEHAQSFGDTADARSVQLFGTFGALAAWTGSVDSGI